jgi:peptidoglycan/LPS O-acetylase OafA/YrhL
MTVLPERPGPHYGRVDAVRGIAALMVAGTHVLQTGYGGGRHLFETLPGGDPSWDIATRLLRRFLFGHNLVILFFVLSGFVLALSLERGPQGLLAGARRFFGARLLRLYPAVLATMAAFAAVYFATGHAIPGAGPESYSLAGLVRNALLLETTIDGVTWTLQVELLAAPLVFLAHRLRRQWGEVAVALLGVLFVLTFARYWAVDIKPQVRLFVAGFAFVFGMLVPTAGRAVASRVPGRLAGPAAAASLLLFFVARMVFGMKWGIPVEGVASAAFLALLVYGPQLRAYRALDVGFARFYGKISYSFYLLHPMTLMVIWNVPDAFGALVAAGVPPPILALALWAATAAAVTPLAMASYRFVELPAMQLSRRLGWAGSVPKPGVAPAVAVPPPGGPLS